MALTFKSTLDDTSFAAGLRRMETGASAAAGKIGGALSGIGGGLGIAGGLGLAGIAAGAGALIEKFSELHDEAAAINMPVEDFQRLAFVFTQAGAATEDSVKGVANLSKALTDARDPATQQAKAMETLGLSLAKTNEADATGALADMADAYNNSADKGAAFAAISDLVGAKLAVKLIPALSEGGAEMRRIAASADVASEAMVNFAESIGDKISAAKQTAFAKLSTTGFLVGKAFVDNFNKGVQDAKNMGAEGTGIGGLIKGMLGIGSALGRTAADAALGRGPGSGAVDEEQLANEDKHAAEKKAQKDAIAADIERRKRAEELVKAEKTGLELYKAAKQEEEEASKRQHSDLMKRMEEAKNNSLKNKEDQRKAIEENSMAARKSSLEEVAATATKQLETLGGLREKGIAREAMTPQQRRAADHADKMQKRVESRFDKKHPELVRAAEVAKMAKGMANNALKARVDPADIKTMTEGIATAVEKIVAK